MKLISISANIIGGEFVNNWSVEKVCFDQGINLIVGQNATGKSRMINVIQDLADTIRNGKYMFSLSEKVELECVFKKDNGDILTYSFALHIHTMDISVLEQIVLNDQVLLKRDTSKTEIYSYSSKKNLEIDPPEDKLVLHVRRDKIEFPFLEDLVHWANKISIFPFGKLNTPYLNRPNINPSWLIQKLNAASIQNVIDGLNKLGYVIENLEWEPLRDKPGNVILIKEKGFEKFITEYDLSQGMFRALGLLIYIENLIQNNSISTVIVDDIGEGLDYERATKLGKLLVEKLENSNIQFIATSNDEFLMNVIDTKYWNILERDGNTVKSFNYTNSKAIFDDFRMSGLSNFYLLSSNFLSLKQL